MYSIINTFFAKRPSSRTNRSGKSPYQNRQAASSDGNVNRSARDYQDSYGQALGRTGSSSGSPRSPRMPDPPWAADMYYVDGTRTQTAPAPKASSRGSSNAPRPLARAPSASSPGASLATNIDANLRTQTPTLPLQPGSVPHRRPQSISKSQPPDPNLFIQNSRKSSRSNPPRTIYFYGKEQGYYSFSNFSPYEVLYEGRRYPTSEHLFQAMKFLSHRPHLAEHIRTVGERAELAFTEAQRLDNEARPDWHSVKLEMMDLVLNAKFTQHPKLRKELLATGDAHLVFDSSADAFWGNGADGQGHNNLGYALMSLRERRQNRQPLPASGGAPI